MKGSRRLLLFDVDGTLLTSGRVVRDTLAAALNDVFGTAGDIDGYRFEGKLDPIIVTELMQGGGIDETTIEGRRQEALRVYLDRLEKALESRRPVLKPGVETLLSRLAADEAAVLALLTGNLERGARIKLTAAGIWHLFAFGVWGDDAPRREELGAVALQRARRATGRAFTGPECVVVGDSVHDVACGLAFGARVVAVATGRTDVETLRRAGATFTLRDLSDLAAAREALLG